MDIFTTCALGKYDLVMNHLKRDNKLALTSNKEGWTPLMYACYYCHANIANYLTAIEPSCIYRVNKSKQTALMLACYSSDEQLIESILTDDTLQYKDADGWNALFYAVYYGPVEAVKLLISRGIDLNCKDKEGKTALMIAALENMLNVVGILIMSNADTNILSDENKTAIHYAISKSHYEAADLLSMPRCTDLTKLLERLSLDKYITIFEENSVDLSEFLKMTEDDLKNVGIRLFGPRRKMAITISKLNYLNSLVNDIQNRPT